MSGFRATGLRCCLSAAVALIVAATAVAQVPSGYTIEAFRDDFDGTSLDTAKWNAGVINYPSGSTWLWRNHPGNNTVAGGFLIQTTLYQDVTGDGVPEWTCSSVGARSFSQRFGYWESRIRITDYNWTDNAWWSTDIGTGHLSGMDGFEIDAPEAWSPNRYTASIYDHAVQDGSAPSSIHFEQTMTGKNFTANFSVFGWDWGTDNSVKCYVDGVLVKTFSAADMNGIEALVPQGPVQGTALWTTGLTPSNQVANGDSKYVDYVRVYQKPGWTGTSAVKRWSDSANWGPDGVPASGRAAVFNTAAASGTITLSADQPVQELVFQGGDTGTTTIAGPGRLLLGMTTAVTATTGAVGGINLVNDTTAGVTVTADIVAQRKLQFSNFAGASITPAPTPGVDLVLAGRLSASGTGTPINFLTTAPIVVTGTIDGSVGRITKGGQGVVRLNAANAFTGGLEIRDGIIEVNADGALGAVGGGVTMAPGSAYDQPSLVLNAIAYTDPVPIAIRGAGTRTANYPQSSGAIDASGTSRFAGPITAIDDATIYVQRNGNLTLSGTVDTRDHVLTLGSLGTLVVTGRVTGSSTGLLDKFNSGTAFLSGDNTGFLGAVQVRFGTLSVNGDAALGGGTGDVVRLAGGALQTSADFTSAKGGSFAATSGNAINTNGRTITFTGEFSGPGGFTKQGAGTLVFGGSNSFQGVTRIQTGTLAAAHPAALAGATLDLASADAGVLQLAVAGTATYQLGGLQGSRDLSFGSNSVSVGHNGLPTMYSGRLLGTGGLVKAGGGVLTLTGSNGFTGLTQITEGVLSISSTAALPGWSTPGRYVVSDGATLAVSNAISDASIATIVQTGNLRAGAAIGFDTSSGTRTYANDLGLLSSTVGLTKVGGAALIIDGSNTFQGQTTVTGGTLQIGTGGTTGSIASTVVSVAQGGVLAFNRSAQTSFSGTIRGAGGIIQQGAGTLVLSGSNDFTGITRVMSGTLALVHASALGGSTLDLAGGDLGTVRLDVIVSTTYTIGGLQGSRGFGIGSNTIAVGGNGTDTVYSGVIAGTGGLVKTGPGRLTLAGTGAFTGVTRITSGTLSLTSVAALEGTTLDLDGADSGILGLDAAGPATYRLGGLAGSRSIAAGGDTLSVGGNGGSTSYLGVISGSGGLEKVGVGTLTLAADQLFTGRTDVRAGTLQIGTGGTTGALSSSVIDVSAAAVIVINRRDTLTVPASITGAGSFITVGTGTVELAGTNTFTGTARVAAGVLSLTSTTALAGATLDLAAGDSGTVSFGMGSPARYQLGGLQGSRNLALGGNSLTVGINDIATTYGGALSGSGRLTKAGAGTLTLTGTNVHTGGTAILAGAVAVSADNRLGATSGGLILDGGTLQTTAGMTLSAARSVTIGPGGGTIDHTVGSNLSVSGSITGSQSTLAVRTSSSVSGAAFLDGAVSLGQLVLSGSTTGVGLRSTAVVSEAIRVGDRQILHLNGLNSSGTAVSVYSGIDVILEGGTLRNRFGGNTLTRSVTLTAASTVENRSGNGNSLTFNAGTLSLGTNTLTVQSGTGASEWVEIAGGVVGANTSGLSVTGSSQLRLSGSNPGFFGETRVRSGTLSLGHVGALVGSTLNLDASDTGTVSFAASGTTYSFGGLRGSRSLDAGGNTLAVGGNGSTTTYGGALSNGSLTKAGGGSLTLSGTSTYTGNTAVSAGRLAVDGVLGRTNLTVMNGAILGGRGALGGTVTVMSGGKLSPGNSIESLGGGALTVSAGAEYIQEIDSSAARAVAGDLFYSGGNLTIAAGAVLSLVELGAPGGWAMGDKLTLISYTGTWNGGVFTYSGSPLGDNASFSFSGVDWLISYADTQKGLNYPTDAAGSYVTITVVPEPSTGAALSVACALGWWVARRRRQASVGGPNRR